MQLNTWEALYFGVDEPSVLALVDQAASLGIERFVLDDGWFLGRTDDRRALGDWVVDPKKFPNGLTPIIEACHEKGMEFGLWIEPEMVSQKASSSRLTRTGCCAIREYRSMKHDSSWFSTSHSRRCLASFRCDSSLLQRILSLHQMGYEPGHTSSRKCGGRHAPHQQTRALYALLHQIKQSLSGSQHRNVRIGGGRADLGILEYTSRVWPSDTNDALDRLRVQRGFQNLFPSELMGSHVGPSPVISPVGNTAWRSERASRFGATWAWKPTFGNYPTTIARCCPRPLRFTNITASSFTGDLSSRRSAAGEQAWMVLAPDHSEALAALAMLETPSKPFPNRYRFIGLDADRHYKLKLVWPGDLGPQQTNHKDALADEYWSGDWLMSVGLSLPILQPESLLIYHLKAV